MNKIDLVGTLNFISLTAILDMLANVFNVEFLQGVLVIVVQFLLTLLVRFVMDKLTKKK
ncbi:MAG: hypothetical protein RBR97_20775 [Bacteroidales bacterium]|nr:hypothetical protein [Bacteroidales bacterium]